LGRSSCPTCKKATFMPFSAVTRFRAAAILEVADMLRVFHVPVSEARATYRNSFLYNMFKSSLPPVWEEDTKVKLAENLTLFTEEYTKIALSVAETLPKLVYKCSMARELFSNSLPVVTLYSWNENGISTQSYLFKRRPELTGTPFRHRIGPERFIAERWRQATIWCKNIPNKFTPLTIGCTNVTDRWTTDEHCDSIGRT